jgi:hypothetical protein
MSCALNIQNYICNHPSKYLHTHTHTHMHTKLHTYHIYTHKNKLQRGGQKGAIAISNSYFTYAHYTHSYLHLHLHHPHIPGGHAIKHAHDTFCAAQVISVRLCTFCIRLICGKCASLASRVSNKTGEISGFQQTTTACSS